MRTLNGPKKSLARQIWDARWLYLLILPGVLYFVVWHYMPMEGILLAFKKYNARLGIWGSEWVGLKNFQRIFITPAAIKAILNTLRVSLSRLVIEFPAPLILALLLYEVVGKRFKKVLQTVYTFPHFLSWVVVSIIVSNFLSNAGFFNSLVRELGFDFPDSMANFIFARHQSVPAEVIFEAAKAENIYVRYFKKPRINNYLRITIGTRKEMEQFLAFLKKFLKDK